MDEELDVVEPTGQIVGRAPRDQVHREGLWHQSFHCLLVRPHAPARVVLQRRRPDAKGFPRLLDLTATGHLEAGETPLDGRRELLEEVGIDVEPSSLVPLGRRLLADDRGEGRNREVAHVFLLADDRPLTAIPVHRGDAASVVEVRVDDLLALLREPAARSGALEWDGTGEPQTITLTADDLVPDPDGYWVVVAVMAQRFVAGDLPLSV